MLYAKVLPDRCSLIAMYAVSQMLIISQSYWSARFANISVPALLTCQLIDNVFGVTFVTQAGMTCVTSLTP